MSSKASLFVSQEAFHSRHPLNGGFYLRKPAFFSHSSVLAFLHLTHTLKYDSISMVHIWKAYFYYFIVYSYQFKFRNMFHLIYDIHISLLQILIFNISYIIGIAITANFPRKYHNIWNHIFQKAQVRAWQIRQFTLWF